MQAILLAALWQILPIVLGALGKLIVDLVQKARPLVTKAAADQKFPNGTARHEFITNELLPTVKSSGVDLIEVLQPTVAGFATKMAFEIVQRIGK